METFSNKVPGLGQASNFVEKRFPSITCSVNSAKSFRIAIDGSSVNGHFCIDPWKHTKKISFSSNWGLLL